MKRYFTIVIIAAALAPVSGIFYCKAEPGRPVTVSETIESIDVNTIVTFWQQAGSGKYGTFSETYQRAKNCFPVGAVIEGYPEKLNESILNCSGDIHRIVYLVEKDGLNPEAMCGISLRSGSDGIISHDIVIVVSRDIGKIAGVYHAQWGR